MHTSGLVVTFAKDAVVARDAQHMLAAAGPFTLGDGCGPCWAVTLEVSDPQAAQRWHDWVEALPGVEAVEVVFVHWDEAESEVNHDHH